MKHGAFKKIIAVFTAAAFMLAAASCTNLRIRFSDSEKIVFTCDNVLLTEPEVRLIAAHYASLFNVYYRELIGGDFWDQEASDGLSYEEYVKNYYVQNECKSLAGLNAMAAWENLRLSAEEEEKIENAAKSTYDRMPEAERVYSAASEETVHSLLRKYYIAQQMITQLVADSKTGISEEASRVADIQVIRMTDRLVAEDVFNRILHNENFLTLARTYSVDETIDYSVSKNDLKEPFHSIVFSMSEGDISELIESEDSFYIIRLVNSYNTLLSMKNSANLLAQQKYEFWSDDLDNFTKDHPVNVVTQNFDEIMLRQFTSSDIFELFSLFN